MIQRLGGTIYVSACCHMGRPIFSWLSYLTIIRSAEGILTCTFHILLGVFQDNYPPKGISEIKVCLQLLFHLLGRSTGVCQTDWQGVSTEPTSPQRRGGTFKARATSSCTVKIKEGEPLGCGNVQSLFAQF